MAFRIQIVRSETAAAPRRRRRWTVVAATVVSVGLLSGVSYAWWTATGSGNASVASVSAQTLSVSGAAVADMYPGKAFEALTFTVSNPNPYVVVLSNSVTLGAATTSNGACATSNLTLASGPVIISGAGPFTVPAKSGGTNGTLTVSTNNFVQLGSGALDACQGVTFTFPVSVTGQQQ